MAKFLFLLALLFIVWRLLFKRQPKPPARPPVPAQQDGERMVPCAWCGVNHPISESLLANGKHYCSEPHRNSAQTAES